LRIHLQAIEKLKAPYLKVMQRDSTNKLPWSEALDDTSIAPGETITVHIYQWPVEIKKINK